nr:MAG TPA: hypothetical protein [Caudoviricetes sp.]
MQFNHSVLYNILTKSKFCSIIILYQIHTKIEKR